MTTKTTAADGLLDEMDSVTTRKRRKPMMWAPLNGQKDPSFNDIEGKPIKYFLAKGQEFAVGALSSIQQTPSGKIYKWSIDGEMEEQSWPYYYCEPQMP